MWYLAESDIPVLKELKTHACRLRELFVIALADHSEEVVLLSCPKRRILGEIIIDRYGCPGDPARVRRR